MEDYLKYSLCSYPWRYMDVYRDHVKTCCWGKQKQPLIFDSNGDLDVVKTWNGDVIREVRNDILNNIWKKNCKLDICPYILNKNLFNKNNLNLDDYKEYVNGPEHINVVSEEACNLWCPQCRFGKIPNTKGTTNQNNIFNGIKSYILQIEKKVNLSMLGNGEPFYVLSIRKFLFETDLTEKPNVNIGFNTNGSLFTPRTWELMKKIQKNINYLSVSVDASTEQTYNKIRLGGNWKQLVKNLEFISSLKKDKKLADVNISMVVQKDNYKEIVDFMKMAENYGFWPYYSVIQSDNHPDRKAWFDEQMVWKECHPLYKNLLEILRDPYLKGKNVVSLKGLYDKANSLNEH